MFGMLPVLLARVADAGLPAASAVCACSAHTQVRRTAGARVGGRRVTRGNSRTIIQATSELGRFTSRDWIGGVDVPTSVVVAMDDQLVPVRRQLKLARSISRRGCSVRQRRPLRRGAG